MAALETTPLYDNTTEYNTTVDNSTTKNSYCQGTIAIEKVFINFTILPACLMLIGISFFQKRKKICTGCCGGRPAISYPVNLIDEHERRWAYAAAFGIVTYKIMLLFDGQYYFAPKQFQDPAWMAVYGFVKIFIQILNVLQVGLVYYPLFVCVVFRRNIVANIFGFLYGAAWFIMSMLSNLACVAQNEAINTKDVRGAFIIDIIFYVPVFICYVILLICYLIDLFINIRRLCNKQVKSQDVFGSNNRGDDTTPTLYVRMLLLRKKKRRAGKMAEKLKNKVKYVNVPGLKYSPRVLCTMVVAGFALFKAAIEVGYWLDVVMQTLVTLGNDYGKPSLEGFFGEDTNLIFDRIIEGITIIRVSLLVCNAVSVVIQIVFMVLMILNYRRHIRKYILGDRSWHYPANQTPSSALVGSMRYSGYQVAFIIYGWVIMMFFLLLIISIITFLIALPVRDGYSTFLIKKLKSLWPTLIVSFIIMILQRLAARFIFLQDKGQHMALDNRRWYHLISYFLFFFNILLGLFSALKRILISMIGGIILLSRLDRTLMMQGLERFDSGFTSYLGMLETELYHNHPIIRFFIECLQEGVKARRHREETRLTLNEEDIGMMETKHRRQILRNKWHKAITLINNPVILVERLNTLVKQRSQGDPANTQKQMVEVLDHAHQLMGSSTAPSQKVTSLYRTDAVPSVPAYVPYIPDSKQGFFDRSDGATNNIIDNNASRKRTREPGVFYLNQGLENDEDHTKL